jgi:NAD(P)H-nitrite reductase large subunit
MRSESNSPRSAATQAILAQPGWLGSSIKKGGDKPRSMELDDELCLCFHVSKRKVINFLRVERPQRESQLSECHGAGTGCGWCRPFLKKLFEASRSMDIGTPDLPDASDYASGRTSYVRSGKGTPPAGATPIEPA